MGFAAKICPPLRYWLFLLLALSQLAFATTHTDSWNTAIITGSLSKDQKLKYYIQPGLSFEDDQYKYRSANLYLGFGYQTSPNVILWLLNGWHNRLSPNGKYRNTDTIRQQINWLIFTNNTMALSSQTRLEERKDYSEAEWSLRLRERLTVRVPLKDWQNHSLVTFDEVFLNLNTPTWINCSSVLNQNHAFVGLGTQLSKTVSFDVGYLNQYRLRTTGNQDNNVLYLVFYVTLP